MPSLGGEFLLERFVIDDPPSTALYILQSEFMQVIVIHARQAVSQHDDAIAAQPEKFAKCQGDVNNGNP